MKLGELANESAALWGKPLDGIRILSFEQYIAMPAVTQMLLRLGAEVVKVEPVGVGEPARMGAPFVLDASGRRTGASMLRFNLGKQSLEIDIKSSRGREILHSLIPQFDVVCENLGPGRAERAGLGYETLSALNERLVYLSITGFGLRGNSPYANWPAMAGVAEAMSGAPEFGAGPNETPIAGRYGPLGDTGTATFGIIGVLAALMHREKTGLGQLVDISMFDSMVALCDYIPNYWSLGFRKTPGEETRYPGIIAACKARDGWFVLHALRRHQFERLAHIVECPQWLQDPRLASLMDWSARLDDTIVPAVTAWAAALSKQEAARILAEAGVPAAPCNSAEEVVNDPHLAKRSMLIEMPRDDGVTAPVIVAGNPVKLSRMVDGGDGAVPLLGQHSDEILIRLLGLGKDEVNALRLEGVIGKEHNAA